VRANAPIDLDGRFDESSWREAAPITQFLQRDPREGAPATEATEVRILYDSRHIYLAVICHGANPSEIRATELRRDNPLLTDDIFEVLFDTFHDHRNGYLFRINPHGTQYDETITNEGATVNSNWDERWEVRTVRTPTGWQAEFAIPFQAMRFAPGGGDSWGVNFHRSIRHKNEDVYWTAHDRGFLFGEVSRADSATAQPADSIRELWDELSPILFVWAIQKTAVTMTEKITTMTGSALRGTCSSPLGRVYFGGRFEHRGGNLPRHFFSSKSSEAELMQNRSPVGCGPSSNTCPRWAWQLPHITSVRFIP
jgi:hypothetical protein